jgi:hypothetical protein
MAEVLLFTGFRNRSFRLRQGGERQAGKQGGESDKFVCASLAWRTQTVSQALCRDPFRKNFSTLQKRLYSALSIESMVPDIECSRISAMYRTSNITNHHQCHEARVPGIACSDLADLTMRDIVTVIYLTGSMGFSLSEALQRTELYYAVPCGGITICDSILKKWRDEAEDANKLIYRRLDDLVYEARTSFFGEEWIVFSATPVRGAS